MHGGHKKNSPHNRNRGGARPETVTLKVSTFVGEQRNLGIRLKVLPNEVTGLAEVTVTHIIDSGAKIFGWNVGDTILAVNGKPLGTCALLLRFVVCVVAGDPF